MMEEQMELTRDSDQECSRSRTVIPSPNPLSGQEIVNYLDQNSLTIVDMGVVANLRKQLDDQLKEFKDKEMQWKEERAKLEYEVKSLECRKGFFVKQHGKLLVCLRKVAELTGIPLLNKSPSKNESKCEFEFVREELLNKFCENVENKFGKKKEEPVDDKPVEVESKSVVVAEEGSPKNAPVSVSTMSMTSGSLENPSENIVKKNLFPSAPCDNEALKPVVPKLVIKKTSKGQQSSVKAQRQHSSSESSAATATLSSWKCEKPKEKKARKSASYSSNEEPQPSPRKAAVTAIKRKITAAVLTLPKPGSPKASSSTSSSSRSQASSTKWRCDKCCKRLDSNRAYKEHRSLVDMILAESKDHNQSFPVYLPKKSRKSVASPTTLPVQVQTPVLPAQTPTQSRVLDDCFLSLSSSSDEDEDMPTAVGISAPQIPEAKSSDAVSGNCRCRVCGDPFSSVAALNFHIRKKHPVNGGPME